MNLDDQPVGAKKGPPALSEHPEGPSEGPVDDGPLEKRIVAKNWQVRAKAYEELSALFKATEKPNAAILKEYAGSWKTYVSDSNPGKSSLRDRSLSCRRARKGAGYVPGFLPESKLAVA